jgi:hypothetical protein
MVRLPLVPLRRRLRALMCVPYMWYQKEKHCMAPALKVGEMRRVFEPSVPADASM